MGGPPPPPTPDGPLQLWLSSEEPDEVAVMLSFSDPDDPTLPMLDLDLVTRVLGIHPTKMARRGEVPERYFPRPPRHSVWSLGGERMRTPPLAEQVRQMLAKLPPPGPAWDELRSWRGELHCAMYLEFWNRECHLSPDVLAAIASRHLDLRLDMYFVDEEPADPGDELDEDEPW
jgi:hypothetical protein